MRRTICFSLRAVACHCRSRRGAGRRRSPEPADPHHRSASRRFRRRSAGAHAGEQDGRAMGAPGRGGEPPRRQRHHRHRRGRQVRARRLHAGLCAGQRGHDQPVIYKKLPYDLVRDFAPITQTVANPLGLISNPRRDQSLKDVVDRAKANPGGLNYGSFGIGNMTHLQGVLLSLAADIKMTHVPYRGQTPMITDILGGPDPDRVHHHGRRRPNSPRAASSTCSPRSALQRDAAVPQHPDADRSRLSRARWWSAGPASGAGRHAEADRRQALRGMAKALAMTDVKEAIMKQGSQAVASKWPDDFARYIKAEIGEIPSRHQGGRPRGVAVGAWTTSAKRIASAC